MQGWQWIVGSIKNNIIIIIIIIIIIFIFIFIFIIIIIIKKEEWQIGVRGGGVERERVRGK